MTSLNALNTQAPAPTVPTSATPHSLLPDHTAHNAECVAGFFKDGSIDLARIPVPSVWGTMRGTLLIRGIVAAVCGSDMGCFIHPRSIDL